MIGFKTSLVLAGIREHPRNIAIAALALAIVLAAFPVEAQRRNGTDQADSASGQLFRARCKQHAGD
jgi:hypothetical protein